MNRIRQFYNKFQVLTTPHQKYNVGFEFMLGSWTDEGIAGFEVKEYDTYYDAECEAQQHPDINWEQLVDFHADSFQFLKAQVMGIIKDARMAVQLKAQIMTPEQAKNKMFERVMKGQETMNEDSSMSGFRPVYDMNDIISFCIVSPWTRNLKELENRLLRHSRLNLFNRIEKDYIVHLVGRTDIGTSYEIVLAPTLLNNWLEWKNINERAPMARQLTELKNCLKLQKTIDSTYVLR